MVLQRAVEVLPYSVGSEISKQGKAEVSVSWLDWVPPVQGKHRCSCPGSG